jgi:hypothetical protein
MHLHIFLNTALHGKQGSASHCSHTNTAEIALVSTGEDPQATLYTVDKQKRFLHTLNSDS